MEDNHAVSVGRDLLFFLLIFLEVFTKIHIAASSKTSELKFLHTLMQNSIRKSTSIGLAPPLLNPGSAPVIHSDMMNYGRPPCLAFFKKL